MGGPGSGRRPGVGYRPKVKYFDASKGKTVSKRLNFKSKGLYHSDTFTARQYRAHGKR